MNVTRRAMSFTCSLLILVAAFASTSAEGTYAVKDNPPNSCDQMAKDKTFECGDGTCVWVQGVKYPKVCDGYIDCYTGKDEENCDLEHRQYCTEDRGVKPIFQCNDGMCIDASWENDGEFDCLDKSDESTPQYSTRGRKPSPCEKIPEDERFECGDGTCVVNGEDAGYNPRVQVCNAYIECYTGADEADCGGEHTRLCFQDRRSKSIFRCDDGMCIEAAWENDGEIDCLDKSDEHAEQPTIE